MFARVWAVEAASSGKQAFLSIFSNLDSQYQDKQDRSKIKDGSSCKSCPSQVFIVQAKF